MEISNGVPKSADLSRTRNVFIVDRCMCRVEACITLLPDCETDNNGILLMLLSVPFYSLPHSDGFPAVLCIEKLEAYYLPLCLLDGVMPLYVQTVLETHCS